MRPIHTVQWISRGLFLHTYSGGGETIHFHLTQSLEMNGVVPRLPPLVLMLYEGTPFALLNAWSLKQCALSEFFEKEKSFRTVNSWISGTLHFSAI